MKLSMDSNLIQGFVAAPVRCITDYFHLVIFMVKKKSLFDLIFFTFGEKKKQAGAMLC